MNIFKCFDLANLSITEQQYKKTNYQPTIQLSLKKNISYNFQYTCLHANVKFVFHSYFYFVFRFMTIDNTIQNFLSSISVYYMTIRLCISNTEKKMHRVYISFLSLSLSVNVKVI